MNQPNITNHGLNSEAAVRFGIQRHTNIHPFYVLRQAELSTDTKRREILEVELTIEHSDRAYQECLNRLTILNGREQMCSDRHLGWLFRSVRALKNYAYKLCRLQKEQDERFSLEADIRRYALERPKADRDLRDLRMELSAAEDEKQRFYTKHPEYIGKTYQEIQSVCSEEALLNRIAASFAAHMWAGEGSAAFTVLIDLSHEQRLAIFKKERELRTQMEGHTFNEQAYNLLQSVPVEERENFLAAAAALCRQSNFTPLPCFNH